jgi:hypothetical protein
LPLRAVANGTIGSVIGVLWPNCCTCGSFVLYIVYFIYELGVATSTSVVDQTSFYELGRLNLARSPNPFVNATSALIYSLSGLLNL